MNIQNRLNCFRPYFSAKTTINAPKELITEDQNKLLTKLGNKVGTNNDTLEFDISKLHKNSRHPEIKTYTVTTNTVLNTKTGILKSKSTKDIPYEKNGQLIDKNSPFNFIKTIINRYLK